MIHGFGDESFVERDGVGVYVIGLIVLTDDELDEARLSAKAMSPREQTRFHFHDLDDQARRRVVSDVLQGPWCFRFWWKSSTPRLQERTRRILLNSALLQHSREQWTLESRGNRADIRDRELAEALLGFRLSQGVRLTHQRASDEPLLWPADVVASASAQSLIRGVESPFGTSSGY